MHADSSRRALEQLHSLGVEVRLGKPVTAVFADGVEVDGERLHSHNVIWAAGVRASPLVQTLGAESGPGGRVKVMPDCSVPEYPKVFVIGDAAVLVDSRTGLAVPGVSQGAIQMGRFVAEVINEDCRGSHQVRSRGFHYKDLGSMATVGKSRAVVEIGRLHFGGLLAWLAWLTLHVTTLIGFRIASPSCCRGSTATCFPARLPAHHRVAARKRETAGIPAAPPPLTCRWPLLPARARVTRRRPMACSRCRASSEFFKYSRRAVELVWSTSRTLTLALAVLTLIAGVLPASVAFVGSRIVDSVVAAMRSGGADASRVLEFVLLEGILVAGHRRRQRGISLCQSLLRAQLGQRVERDDPGKGAHSGAAATSRTRSSTTS